MNSLKTIILFILIIAVVRVSQAQTGAYAAINDMNLYYEIHGVKTRDQPPLFLLHGAYATLSLWGDFLAELATTRQVIVLDFQGHGRTKDINRPITYEYLADDVAGLIQYLEYETVDLFGYSMGGGVALQVGIRYPELIRKMVVASATYRSEGMYPELLQMISQMKPEYMEGTPFKIAYDSLAPDPAMFPVLMEKLIQLDETPQHWLSEDIANIQSPILFISGDADVVTPEHTVEMYRLKGGSPSADFMSAPNSQLAILPGTTHIGVMERTEWLLSMIPVFLDQSVTPKKQDLIITRTFQASLEEVWNAWTDEDVVVQWWGPEGFTSPFANMNVKEGGISLVCMHSQYYGNLYNTWRYTEIIPHQRLEFIHNMADKDGNTLDPVSIGMPSDFPKDQRHLITFKEVSDNVTEITITEFNWPVGQMMEMSRKGMEQCLDKMEKIFNN